MKVIKDNKGQALVEFAIILPILMLIVMGIIQFGFMINSYLTIANLSREAARLGIIGSSYSEIENDIIFKAPNLDADELSINISPSDSNRKSGDTLNVKIYYNYKLTVPIISSMFNNEIELSSECSMRIE
ncbi:MAG: TadE/TadG family type IV pilus assembly protein [Clostridiaceae bacterium]